MQFKPAITIKDATSYKAPYEHMSDRVDVRKSFKDLDGRVKLQPRNIITNPPKKGEVGKQTTFGGNLPHMPDLYDNQKLLARKELEAHKLKVQEKPWSERVPSLPTFNKPLQVYGEDVVLP